MGGAAAGPAGSIDVPGQRIPQFPGVPSVQVDLILGAVQPEPDGTLLCAAVDVIAEQGLDLLSRGLRLDPRSWSFSALVYAV